VTYSFTFPFFSTRINMLDSDDTTTMDSKPHDGPQSASSPVTDAAGVCGLCPADKQWRCVVHAEKPRECKHQDDADHFITLTQQEKYHDPYDAKRGKAKRLVAALKSITADEDRIQLMQEKICKELMNITPEEGLDILCTISKPAKVVQAINIISLGLTSRLNGVEAVLWFSRLRGCPDGVTAIKRDVFGKIASMTFVELKTLISNFESFQDEWVRELMLVLPNVDDKESADNFINFLQSLSHGYNLYAVAQLFVNYRKLAVCFSGRQFESILMGVGAKTTETDKMNTFNALIPFVRPREDLACVLYCFGEKDRLRVLQQIKEDKRPLSLGLLEAFDGFSDEKAEARKIFG